MSKIFPAERLLDEAVKLGETISEKTSKLTSAAAKAAVNASQETTLKQGLETERRLFQMTFATVRFFLLMVSTTEMIMNFSFSP